MAAPEYTTVTQVRAFTGLREATADDDAVEALIRHYSVIAEEYCGVWFEARTLTIYMDGTSSNTLFLPVPIISVTALRINDELEDTDDALDASYYVVETDPRNPMIRFKQPTTDNLYDRIALGLNSSGRLVFIDGQDNQRIDGSFGWVDTTGPQAGAGAPLLVQNAIARLVTIHAVRPMVDDPMQVLRTDLEEEWTDGHRLRFSNRKGRRSAMVPDPIAASWLNKHKAPLAMGVAVGITG